MRAAIAVRVSPRAQDKIRYSPELQESKCREWCAAHGHEVVTVVSDILVSGGASDRFDSVFAALDEHRVEMFVVADLSRWTRDRPSRFWAIKSILEDRSVQLVSVDDPYLGSDTPFSDTVTTARVEANYQERVILKRKTSEGVRKAWAAGKRWGHPFGWTWDRRVREWSYDRDLIEGYYRDWIAGMTAGEMARKYHMEASNVAQRISAVSQIDVIGRDLWEQAQGRIRPRAARADSRRSSMYRGLLICPFCDGTLAQHWRWGNYICRRRFTTPHDWWVLSARVHVMPAVVSLLERISVPLDVVPRFDDPQSPVKRENKQNIEQQIERLTLAWVSGRVSQATYDRQVAALEQQRDRPVYVPPIEVRAEFIRELREIDLEDRSVVSGNAANDVLREVITRIELHPDRSVTVVPNPLYEPWIARVS